MLFAASHMEKTNVEKQANQSAEGRSRERERLLLNGLNRKENWAQKQQWEAKLGPTDTQSNRSFRVKFGRLRHKLDYGRFQVCVKKLACSTKSKCSTHQLNAGPLAPLVPATLGPMEEASSSQSRSLISVRVGSLKPVRAAENEAPAREGPSIRPTATNQKRATNRPTCKQSALFAAATNVAHKRTMKDPAVIERPGRKQRWARQMSLPLGARLLSGMAAYLVLLLVFQIVWGAPIGQYGDTVQPIWLTDGLMSVSDSNSLDARSRPQQQQQQQQQQLAFEDAERRQTELENLIDGIQNDAELQQQIEQQQQELARPQQNWPAATRQDLINQAEAIPEASEEAPPTSADSNDYFWIERRRLNRDRALEPPAWMRDRPIRRDSSAEHQQLQRAQDAAPLELEEGPNKPIRARFVRGRQLRQSSGEFPEELLAHLLEEALEGRAILENFYDQLETTRRLRELQKELKAGSASRATTGKLVALPKAKQNEAALEDEQDELALSNAEVEQQSNGQGLVLAGDEISDNNDDDDVTFLELPPTVVAAQKQQEQSQPVLAVGQKLTKVPLELIKQQAGDMMIELGPTGSGQDNSLANVPSVSGNKLPLLELVQKGSVGGRPTARPSTEQSFHVIEDIDQPDDGQEVALVQLQQQQERETQKQQQQQQRRRRLLQEGAAGQLNAPPGSGQRELLASQAADTAAAARAEPEPEPEPEPDKRSMELEQWRPEWQAGDERNTMPMRRSSLNQEPAGFGDPLGLVMLMARDERSRARPPAPGARTNNPRTRPAKATSAPRPPLVMAVQMIQSGFFSRAQLIQFATKIRVYLENSLQLARGAILGLFPINSKQLLVELDLSKLSASDRTNLMENFAYVRGASSLVLNWPSGLDKRRQPAGDNPLPILIAILDALYDDDDGDADADADEAQSQQKPARLAEVAPPNESGQLVNVDDLARSLLADASNSINKLDSSDFVPTSRRQLWPSSASNRPLQSGSSVVSNRAQVQLANAGELQQRQAALDFDQIQQERASEWLKAMYENQQPPLATLAAYISSLYNFDPQDSMAAAAAAILSTQQQDQELTQEAPLVREQLIERLRLMDAKQLANKTEHSEGAGLFAGLFGGADHSAHWINSAASFLVVLLLALMSTCLIVKLVMRRFEGRLGTRVARGQTLCNFGDEGGANDDDDDDDYQNDEKQRQQQAHVRKERFWWPARLGRSRGPSEATEHSAKAIEGKTGQAASERPLCEANKPAHLSADSAYDTEAGSPRSSRQVFRNNLELLSERWAKFVNKAANVAARERLADEQQQQSAGDSTKVAAATGTVSSNSTEAAASAPATGGAQGNFRTSTSYIRSLIEAITKAASSQQMASSTTQTSGRYNAGAGAADDDDDDDDGPECANSSSSSACLIPGGEQKAPHRSNKSRQLQDELDSQEILMSQMDISAAHLILDYMEKHLIDKERLRREWLELNASHDRQQPAGSNGAAAGPKSAQSKANRLILQRLAKVALSEENAHKNRDLSVVPFDRNRVRLGVGASQLQLQTQQLHHQATNDKRDGLAEQAKGAAWSPDDYVNASFIYDDDPRRPTHIIAQGPTERSCGQFWQMIWEQEISVIVMLTRLNENGRQMCQCYWPRDVAPVSASSEPPIGAPNSASGQRGSVTSVFSGISHAANGTHPHHHHQHGAAALPIVTSGEPNDNVLVFEVPLQRAAVEQRTSLAQAGARRATLASGGGGGGSGSGGTGPSTGSGNADKERAACLRLKVHLISEHMSSSDYLVRNMYLINGTTGETRTISQFHYLAWPCGQTPDNVRNFLQFRRKVHKSYRNPRTPILVHCNDGAGRSGTYTLIDMILERIKNGAKEIDLRATLEHLRDQRIGLCETQAQFEFVLVALAEEIHIILNALPQ